MGDNLQNVDPWEKKDLQHGRACVPEATAANDGDNLLNSAATAITGLQHRREELGSGYLNTITLWYQ